MAKRKKNNPHKNPNATTHISTYKNYNSNVVMTLAYMHRYLFPIALGLLPVLIATIIGKDYLFIGIGTRKGGSSAHTGAKIESWRAIFSPWESPSF